MPPALPNHYELLEVSPNASTADIQRAYKKKALQHHPDKNPERVAEATELFKRIAEAYACLRDPSKRSRYNRELASRGGKSPGSADDDFADEDVQGFTFAMAKEIFRETFGDEVVDALERMAESTAAVAQQVAPQDQKAVAASVEFAKHAAPHLQIAAETTACVAQQAASALGDAAERCGRSERVKSTVISGFESMASEAETAVRRWEAIARRRKQQLELRQRELDEHRTSMEAEKERRGELQAVLQSRAVWSSFQAGCCLLCLAALLVSVGRHAFKPKALSSAETTSALLAAPVVFFTTGSCGWLCVLVVVGSVLSCLDVQPAMPPVLLPATIVLLALRACWNWSRLVRLQRDGDSWLAKVLGVDGELQARCDTAQQDLASAEERLAKGKLAAERARLDADVVDRDGASLSSAARVGLHYVGKLIAGPSRRALQ